MDGTDPWSVLGVDPSASPAELKTAFRRRCLECHPDRGGDVAAFERLQAAYRSACAGTAAPATTRPPSSPGSRAGRARWATAESFGDLTASARPVRRARRRPSSAAVAREASRQADALAFSRALDQALRAA
ncbi:MAG: J domain-containing protein [Acidimicrobiales bacterium]